MRSMFLFIRCLLRMPTHWVIWVGGLVLANLILPLVLLLRSGESQVEAVVVLGFFLLGAVAQMLLFSRLGFVRFLGLGHFGWLVMLPWLYLRYPDPAASSPLIRWWIVSVLVLNVVSLLIDISDVVRYLKGERAPTVSC